MSKTNTEKMAPENTDAGNGKRHEAGCPRASDRPNGKPAGVCQCYDWRML